MLLVVVFIHEQSWPQSDRSLQALWAWSSALCISWSPHFACAGLHLYTGTTLGTGGAGSNTGTAARTGKPRDLALPWQDARNKGKELPCPWLWRPQLGAAGWSHTCCCSALMTPSPVSIGLSGPVLHCGAQTRCQEAFSAYLGHGLCVS